MGGEKMWFRLRSIAYLGSPPRGRGKEIMVTLQDINARITPAWAGKSAQAWNAGEVDMDHPRVGGEKQHRAGW